jgi:hypothetical protein
MARKPKPKLKEKDVQGFKYLDLIVPFLEKLHDHACERDRAHNRTLHYDEYICLLLLHFFNPMVASLRSIQQASELEKVQQKLGCPRSSLGSLSEAARVFDPELLMGIIADLAGRVPVLNGSASLQELKGVLTLVDGTLLKALPELVEAVWLDREHRAFKLHTQFELLKSVPVRMDLTAANRDERAVLAETLLSGRIYVMDRGYAKFELFRDIVKARSSFVCRIRDNSVFEVVEERELSRKALDAGVVRDAVVRFVNAKGVLDSPVRIVEVECRPHRKASGKTGRGGPEQGDTILIATDLLEPGPEVISLIYKHRWAIETFFRFFKHVLGCRHLLSHCSDGIRIQMYVAILVCLLLALWTGKKPTLRTYEMICFYFSGWASEEELVAHIEKLKSQS